MEATGGRPLRAIFLRLPDRERWSLAFSPTFPT